MELLSDVSLEPFLYCNLWVIFVALCIAGYFAIQSEFMKMEAPVQRQKPFLGDY